MPICIGKQELAETFSGLAKVCVAKEKQRLSANFPDFPPDLPCLRRLIELTDYDAGTPITHRVELYRSDSINCYNVTIDGRSWRQRIGWSYILEGLPKGLPRLRQFD